MRFISNLPILRGSWRSGDSSCLPGSVKHGVDTAFACAHAIPVQFLRQFVTVLLLAVWMPATLHCGLESVEFVANLNAKTCCADVSQTCLDDGCNAVEEIVGRPSGDLLKAPAPAFLACAGLLCLSVDLFGPVAESVLPGASIEAPLAWVPTWHFARRAALPARAPNSVA